MSDLAELDYALLDDDLLATCYGRQDPQAVRLVMARNNQRLFRVAFSILKNRSEAEDVVQNVYLKAFSAIDSFNGKSSLSTWLTRIAINAALEQQRTSQRRKAYLELNSVIAIQEQKDANKSSAAAYNEPDRAAAREQLRKLIESAINKLPEKFRLAFVLREVEEMSVVEIADVLHIPAATVKTRSLRARRLLQQALLAEIGETLSGSFPFAGADCAAMTRSILQFLDSRKETKTARY